MPGGEVDPELGVGVVRVVRVARERLDADSLGMDLHEDLGGLDCRARVAEGDHREVAEGAVVAGPGPVAHSVGRVDGSDQGGVELLDNDCSLEARR